MTEHTVDNITTEADAIMQHLSEQRNAALNDCAKMRGQLALQVRAIAGLQAEIEELRKAPE